MNIIRNLLTFTIQAVLLLASTAAFMAAVVGVFSRWITDNEKIWIYTGIKYEHGAPWYDGGVVVLALGACMVAALGVVILATRLARKYIRPII